MYSAILFAVGELIALVLFLLTLHWLRRAVGLFPMYLLLGLFFIYSQLSIIPPIFSYFSLTETPDVLYNGFLMIPVILAFLLFYEDEGTLEAQRIIFGLMVATLGFLYLTQLILSQFNLGPDKAVPEFLAILSQDDIFTRPFLCLAFFHIGLLLVLPVPYQLTRNLHFPVAISLWLNTALFLAVSYAFQAWFNTDASVPIVRMQPIVWVAWGVALIIVCVGMQFYISIAGHANLRKNQPLGIFKGLFIHLQSAARMRQSVEEWEGRYQAFFDHATDMIFLVEKDGSVINANRSALNLLGSRSYSEGFSILPFLQNGNGTPFDWENAWQSLRGNALLPEKSLSCPNLILSIPDHAPVNIDLNLSAARDRDQLLGVLILRDTTEQHRVEEQLKHSQRLEALGTLAGGVAHDFNNLLLGIQASAEAMRREPLSPSSLPLLDNIEDATHRAADLTQKLLGFARKGKYQPQKLNITHVAKHAATLFEVGHKTFTFKFLAPPEPIYVLGDETQLQQVILNLLLNAKDALKEGSVEDRKVTLRIDLATEDMPEWEERPDRKTHPEDYVVLRVKDNGKGMSDEVRSHIFEPFYSTKGVKGTGLGLSMAYGCITNHQGWMHVRSGLDKGSELTIFLPICKDDSPKKGENS